MEKKEMIKKMARLYKDHRFMGTDSIEDVMVDILNMQMRLGMAAPVVEEEYGYGKTIKSRYWETKEEKNE